MAGFGGAVKLTGESEYRKAIQNITKDLSKMSSALKSQTAEYSANDRSITNTAQKQKQLTQAISQQQQKLAQAKSALAQYSVTLQAQQTRHNALTSEYKKSVQELDRIKAASGETSAEYKKQAAAVEKLGSDLAKSTAEMNESKTAMSALKSEINNSQKTITKTQKELDGLGKEAKEAGEDAKKGGDGFTVMKGVLANLASSAIMAAVDALKNLGGAVVEVGKQAVDSYANFEQLEGGVKKLFGNMGQSVDEYAKTMGKSVKDVEGEWKALEKGQNDVLKNAANAYQTAGMSANDYMETVTGFSAALIAGLDGDTVKAAKVADTAIQDMADNANTFGTNISSIQDAYQGFAKQNYTMLDNLKLGYGGTQSEMARLINDSGVLGDTMEVTAKTVNDVSYDKIIEAIHKIQEEQNIAGTTSREAASTIEGSKNMMLASWQNLLTGMADENQKIAPLFQNVADSIGIYMGNLLPRISETMKGMSEGIQLAVANLFPRISSMIDNHLPGLIENGTKLISSLVQGIVQAIPLLIQGVMVGITAMIETLGTEIPNIVNTVIEVVPQIINQLMANLPTFIQGCITFLNGIVEALPTVIQNLVAALPTVITSVINGLLNGIDALITGAVEFLTAIVDAIPQILPSLIEAIPTIIDTLVTGLTQALPELLDGAITLLMAIIEAIPQIIPPLVEAIPDIISTIITTLADNIPLIVDAGIQLLTALIQNMPAILAGIAEALPTIVTSIFDGLVEGIPQIAEAGLQLIQGLWEGIKNAGGWLLEQIGGFASGIVDGICGFFGINSPSTVMRDQVGKNLADGIGEGFTDEMGNVSAQMEKEGGDTVKQLSSGMDSKQSTVGKTAQELANAIVKTFTANKAKFTAIGKNVSTQIANGVKTASKQVQALVKNMVTSINAAFKASSASFNSAGKNIATNIAKGLKSGQSAAATAAKAIASAIAKAFTSQASTMRNAGKNLATQLNTGIKSGQSAVTSTAKAIAKAIVTAITSQSSAMRSAGAKMASQLATGLKSGQSGVKSAAKSLASAAGSAAGNYSAFRSAGVNMASGLKNGFLSQEGSVKSAVNGMVERITASARARMKIKSPSRVWAEIGDYMAQGMGVGFADGMGGTIREMLNSFDGLMASVNDYFGIASPSKKMRDKVGKQLVAGIAVGIKKNTNLATSAFDTLNNAIMATATAGTGYKNAAKTAISAFTSGIKDAMKVSEAQAKATWENWYNARAKEYDKQEKKLQNKIKASDAKYDKLIKKTKKKSDKKKLQSQKASAKKELQKQLDAVKARDKTLTSTYKNFGKDTLAQFNKAMESATTGVTDALGTKLQSIADTMQEKLDAVNSKIETMRDKLVGYGELFTINSRTGYLSLNDLTQNTKAINQYGANIEKLKKLVSSDLMEEIVSLGIDEGLRFTNRLLSISSKELAAYNKAYTAQVNAAKAVSSKFYSEQVAAIKNDYTKQVTAALNDAKKQIETIGAQTMQGFINGMNSVKWAKDVKKIAQNIIKKMKKELGIKSPSRVFMEIGEYSGEGYTLGLADELKNVSSVMAAAIPSDMGDYSGNSGKMAAATTAADMLTPDKMVSAFKEALSQMKVELDNDEVGRFIDKTVTRLVYN